jgi:putative membrane protein
VNAHGFSFDKAGMDIGGIIAFCLEHSLKFMSLVIRWFINALALMLVAYLYSGVQVSDIFSALIAALVLGLVNALVRPILVILTLPVTVLTLGLFIFIINAFLFWFVAEVVKGFNVTGFMAALIGSLMFSVITIITSWLISGPKKSK